jgi:hypothetical protein
MRGQAAMALNERGQQQQEQRNKQHMNKDFGYTSQRLDKKHNNEFNEIHKKQVYIYIYIYIYNTCIYF